MLYEVTYGGYSSTQLPDPACAGFLEEIACSCVRNGGLLGRNCDYIMNSCPTFVIRTPAKAGRYATLGIARLSKINPQTVENGLPQDKIDLLPWALLDGMNEKGLCINFNTVPKADWGKVPHTGTNPGAPELNGRFAARAVLDNCASADEALDYLKKNNITPWHSEKYDLHFMISDPGKNYVVEFIDNELVAREQLMMTNYFVNIGTIPEHPMGIERMDILRENYNEADSMEGMLHLLKRVKCTNMYVPAYGWYSEDGAPYSELQNISKAARNKLLRIHEKFTEEMEYVKENGYKENTKIWDTAHTSIYDINSRKLFVTIHERFDEAPYEFCMEC